MSKPDNNFLSFADLHLARHSGLHIDPREEGKNPADFDDLLKISHCTQTKIERFTVLGGGLQRENAIDLNRECYDVRLQDGTIEAGKQNAITIKGGCDFTSLARIVIIRAGGNCDIELGNHSDQSTKRTTRTYLHDVARSDGRPLRVTVGNADWPLCTGTTRIERQYFRSYRLKAYLLLKTIFANL